MKKINEKLNEKNIFKDAKKGLCWLKYNICITFVHL